MPHLFLKKDHFNENTGFQTRNAILTLTPYAPKVLMIGTYNDGGNANNQADFFYGRNYFWPIFENFSQNNRALSQRRFAANQQGIANANPPTLQRILILCSQFKLTFADLIQDVLIPLPNHDDTYLNQAVGAGQTTNNHENIAKFINDTPSIEDVYLTTALQGYPHLNGLWEYIVQHSRGNVTFRKILTPSGRGNIPAIPNQVSAVQKIARYWVWVNDPASPNGVVMNATFHQMNHEWLIQSGVNPMIY
ncbi:hypothetical protein CJD36_021340 [Flavipsychrobacter stenotrophus]|uniref:Uracil-DNA glycosylase-like domain-containing protein n=1 Tax=Flavipsychrobacter stenotrophus TaxID=2077091 RepID=A0A2S7SQW4_9BACT|nr:hypothetical protein [Flavipsychrobacter stenotrophus]PQJ08956.1 hypothetical protein CJD36_021340 [Flavipsychrobacter stenotrophus]